MTRRRRILLAIFAGLGLLTAAAAAFLWWAVTTPAGARWVLARAADRVSGSLRVESLEGTLSGPLVIEGLDYRSETMSLAVARLELDWRPRALWSRLLDISRIDARGIRVVRSASSAEPASEGLPAFRLPVNVVVREASVSDVEILGPEAGPPIRIERIELASRTQGGRVLVDRFSVRGPAVSVRAQGELSPSGDYPLDVRFDWSATPAGSPRLAGEGSLSGSLEDLEVRHRLTAPFAANLEASIARPLRDPQVSGRLRADRIELREIDPDWPAVVASVNLLAEGRIAELAVSGFVDARRASGVPEHLRAQLKIARRGDGVRIDDLALTAPGRPGRVQVAGEVSALGSDPRFDLRAKWEDVGGGSAVSTPEGTLTARGRLDDYALSIDAAVRPENGAPGRLSVSARGDLKGMRIETLALLAFSGQVRGAGKVSWKPAVAWDLRLSGEGLDPGAAFPEWPGRIDFTAASAGTVEDGGPLGTVLLSRLDGRLRDEPLSGRAHVEIQPGRYEIRGTEVSLGSARLTAGGEVAGGRSDLQWTLDVPKISEVLPDAAGSLVSSGRWSGGTDRPRVQGRVEGSSLCIGDLAAENLRVEGHVDLGERAQSAIDLSASAVRSGGFAVERVAIHGEGTREAHTLTATASRGTQELRLSVSGGLDGRSWKGEIRTLALRSRELGDWSLERRASLAISSEAASLEGFCWSAAGGGRTLRRRRLSPGRGVDRRGPARADPAVARSRLPSDGTDLDRHGRRRPPGIDRWRPQRRSARRACARCRPDRMELRRGHFDRGLRRLVPSGGRARRGPGRRVAANGRPGKPAGSGFASRLSGAGMPGGGQPLQGRIQAGLPDVALLGAFLPLIERQGGRLEADLEISGTVGDPRVAGLAALREAKRRDPGVWPLAAARSRSRFTARASTCVSKAGLRRATAAWSCGEPSRWRQRSAPRRKARAGSRSPGENFLLSDTEEAVVRCLAGPDRHVAGPPPRGDRGSDCPAGAHQVRKSLRAHPRLSRRGRGRRAKAPRGGVSVPGLGGHGARACRFSDAGSSSSGSAPSSG